MSSAEQREFEQFQAQRMAEMQAMQQQQTTDFNAFKDSFNTASASDPAANAPIFAQDAPDIAQAEMDASTHESMSDLPIAPEPVEVAVAVESPAAVAPTETTQTAPDAPKQSAGDVFTNMVTQVEDTLVQDPDAGKIQTVIAVISEQFPNVTDKNVLMDIATKIIAKVDENAGNTPEIATAPVAVAPVAVEPVAAPIDMDDIHAINHETTTNLIENIAEQSGYSTDVVRAAITDITTLPEKNDETGADPRGAFNDVITQIYEEKGLDTSNGAAMGTTRMMVTMDDNYIAQENQASQTMDHGDPVMDNTSQLSI